MVTTTNSGISRTFVLFPLLSIMIVTATNVQQHLPVALAAAPGNTLVHPKLYDVKITSPTKNQNVQVGTNLQTLAFLLGT
jgi:biopolymer transport protein ExbD